MSPRGEENVEVCENPDIVPDFEARIENRRKMMRSEGRISGGVAKGCSPKVVPEWFDPVAFRRAQDLYRTFGVIIRLSELYGLILVLNFYDGVTPLLVTGNSRTISHLYTRYLSTFVHLHTWFTSDPFHPSSRAYRSLKIVRGYHRQVAGKLNVATGSMSRGKPYLWMSQWGMSQAQFTFMGLMAVFPNELGFQLFSPEDFHAMFHFWRTIGHCLGIEDRFNLCSGRDDEIREICKRKYYEEWMVKIREGDKTGIAMGEGIVIAISRLWPVYRYRAMMHFAAPFMGLPPPQPLTGFLDHLCYYILCFITKILAKSQIVLRILNYLLKATQQFSTWTRHSNSDLLATKFDDCYETDERCPVMVNFNYKTAFEHKLH